MRGAQELANDLHHALELAENERDQYKLLADEADAQGVQLREFGAWLTAEHHYYAALDGPVARTYAKVLARYGQIEGSA